jgi:hypothetical protein
MQKLEINTVAPGMRIEIKLLDLLIVYFLILCQGESIAEGPVGSKDNLPVRMKRLAA